METELSHNAKMTLHCLQLEQPYDGGDILYSSFTGRGQIHYFTENRKLNIMLGDDRLRVINELKSAGLITLGRGRGGTMRLTERGRTYPLHEFRNEMEAKDRAEIQQVTSAPASSQTEQADT